MGPQAAPATYARQAAVLHRTRSDSKFASLEQINTRKATVAFYMLDIS